MPALYVLSLIIVFNLDLSDNYDTDAAAPMFQGLPPNLGIFTRGIAMLVVYVLCAVACFVAYVLMARVSAKDAMARNAAIKERASRVSSVASTGGLRSVSPSVRDEAQKTDSFVDILGSIEELPLASSPVPSDSSEEHLVLLPDEENMMSASEQVQNGPPFDVPSSLPSFAPAVAPEDEMKSPGAASALDSLKAVAPTVIDNSKPHLEVSASSESI